MEPLKVDIVQPHVKNKFHTDLLDDITKIFGISSTSNITLESIMAATDEFNHYKHMWIEITNDKFKVPRSTKQEGKHWGEMQKILDRRNENNQISANNSLKFIYQLGKVLQIRGNRKLDNHPDIVEFIKIHLLPPKITMIIN